MARDGRVEPVVDEIWRPDAPAAAAGGGGVMRRGRPRGELVDVESAACRRASSTASDRRATPCSICRGVMRGVAENRCRAAPAATGRRLVRRRPTPANRRRRARGAPAPPARRGVGHAGRQAPEHVQPAVRAADVDFAEVPAQRRKQTVAAFAIVRAQARQMRAKAAAANHFGQRRLVEPGIAVVEQRLGGRATASATRGGAAM